MTKGHQPNLQVVPHDKRLLVTALAILAEWHPHQLNAQCAIYAIFASLAPPPFFFLIITPVNDEQPKGARRIPVG